MGFNSLVNKFYRCDKDKKKEKIARELVNKARKKTECLDAICCVGHCGEETQEKLMPIIENKIKKLIDISTISGCYDLAKNLPDGCGLHRTVIRKIRKEAESFDDFEKLASLGRLSNREQKEVLTELIKKANNFEECLITYKHSLSDKQEKAILEKMREKAEKFIHFMELYRKSLHYDETGFITLEEGREFLKKASAALDKELKSKNIVEITDGLSLTPNNWKSLCFDAAKESTLAKLAEKEM
ncbi:hypothetical protein KAR26_01495 [Candidatus Parcubacteria bacterium]|nr:hypothetical protein [Candidatus Parcubacteria bacterium]